MKYNKSCFGLTIVIPTFNRIEKLKSRISEILPQMNELDILIISDNATDGLTINSFPELKSDSRFIFHKNEINLGLTANIVKCFERSVGDWMWLASDDDPIRPDAIEIIKCCIEESNVDFINFSTDLIQSTRDNIICTSLDEYFEAIKDNFSNQLLISNNVYNMQLTRQYMKFAYWGCFANAPHIAPVYAALENGGKILLSSQKVVEWYKPSRDECWLISNAYNLLFLADVFSDARFRHRAVRTIIKGLSIPEFLIAQLAFNKINDPISQDKVDSYCSRIMNIYSRYGTISLKLRSFMLRLMIKFPRFYLFIIDIVCKKKYGNSIYDYFQNKKFEFYL